jgi:archaellum component FlaG (FlaF/FlaG flagellin family)
MDSTVSQMIIFIAVVGLAISVSSVLIQINQRVEMGLEEKSDTTSNKLLSDIEVIHVEIGSDISVYVLNTGDIDLSMNDTNLVIDKRWIPDANVTISIVDKATNRDNSWWDPSEILKMQFSNGSSYSAGRHEAMVVIETGISDDYDFTV